MLYVALTRARDRLIVTGTTADAEEMLAKAGRQREFADAYTHRVIESTYLDWIVDACVVGGQYWTVTVVDAAEMTVGDGAGAESAEIPPAADTAVISLQIH